MIRKSVDGLPDQLKEDYIDTDPICVEKIKLLKSVIKSKFPVSVREFLLENLSNYFHLPFIS